MTDQAASGVRTAPREFEADTHQSFLVWRGFFWLKAATLLCLAAIVVYALHNPVDGPNGGTWLGYTLGTIAALFIVWLTWFGIRKRRYASSAKRLEGWLSAHVYLGLSLIILATLHTGFQFGWNVHTLAYTLMMIVIASGAFGVFAYARYPTLMTHNRRGMTTQQFIGQIATLDAEMRHASMHLPDQIARVVATATQQTQIGGSMMRQLTGRYPGCTTAAAFRAVSQGATQAAPEHQEGVRRLLVLLTPKAELLRRIRTDVQYKAIMDVWLYLHVPLTVGLLAALLAHIVSVFFYW